MFHGTAAKLSVSRTTTVLPAATTLSKSARSTRLSATTDDATTAAAEEKAQPVLDWLWRGPCPGCDHYRDRCYCQCSQRTKSQLKYWRNWQHSPGHVRTGYNGADHVENHSIV